jgi:ribosome biogenesis GTPase
VSGVDPLHLYGWTAGRATAFESLAAGGLEPARVLTQARGSTLVITADGEAELVIQRGSRRDIDAGADLPAVGDWLAVEPIAEEGRALRQVAFREILPRSGAFVRRGGAHDNTAEVLAANIDTALLVMGLDADFNLRRLERYLALAYQGGCEPVVVLNKSDLSDDAAGRTADVFGVAPGVPVHAVSALLGDGIGSLERHLVPGATLCLLGSSGAGKSTLANALLGWDRQDTGGVRPDDSRGRHTTRARELMPLPTGSILVDTPGLRSVGLWEAGDGLATLFADIEELAGACRFRDCAHLGEPGCAVLAAVGDGRLSAARLDDARRLWREVAAGERRRKPASSRAASRQFGRLTRNAGRDAMARKGMEVNGS